MFYAKLQEIVSYNSKHEGDSSPETCVGSNKRCLMNKPES